MAEVPYSSVPQDAPRTDVPDDYQHLTVTPDMFGASVGRGLEALGQGALKASQFYGQAAADDAANHFQEGVTKLLHGDSTKMVPGPDGKMQPDTGFLGLNGRAALDARPNVESQIDQLYKQIGNGLTTPESKLQFDSFSRRYRAGAWSQIGSHADTQAKTWATQVNKGTGNIALNAIAADPDNIDAVNHATADILSARIKDAQLAGGGPELLTAARESAVRDAFKAQVQAIGVRDPARAMKMLDDNRKTVGDDYTPLANEFRARADQAAGVAAGQKVLASPTNRAAAVAPAAQSALLTQLETRHGLPSGYLWRTEQIESQGGKDLTNKKSGAAGPFQFIPKTAAAYGVNPHDFASSAAGAAQLASDNAKDLRLGLGREPTAGEIYLAHQQGAKGAVQLLTNPDAPASSIVGTKAVIQNGGTQSMTARQFASLWINKFEKGSAGGPTQPYIQAQGDQQTPQQVVMQGNQPGAAPTVAPDAPVPDANAVAPPAGSPASAQAPAQSPYESRKSEAYQQILNDPNLSIEGRQHALQYVNQTLMAEQIAEQEDEKARKKANDDAADGYIKRVLKGDTNGLLQEIIADPHLTHETRWTLGQLAVKHTAADAEAASYGPSFASVLHRVAAPQGDPTRITDPMQILQLAADPNGGLSISGAQKLQEIMKSGQRDPDQAAVTTARSSVLSGFHDQLSFEQDTGPIKIRDPKGEQIYKMQFVPQYEAAYDQWLKQGKNPWDFINSDFGQKLAAKLRKPADMAADRIAAGIDAGESPPPGTSGQTPAAPTPAPVATGPVPSPPENVDTGQWKTLMTHAPIGPDGKPWTAIKWAKSIFTLAHDPTPKMKALFNQTFQAQGFDADDVLRTLFHNYKTDETLAETAGRYPTFAVPRIDPDMGSGWSPPVTGGQ